MSNDSLPSPPVTPDRWLKVWAESTTDGLWDRQGQMVFSDDLPLTEGTRKRLAAWAEWIDDFEDYLPPQKRAPPIFPLDAFNSEGRVITAIIQRELPDWTVVYREIPLQWVKDSD